MVIQLSPFLPWEWQLALTQRRVLATIPDLRLSQRFSGRTPHLNVRHAHPLPNTRILPLSEHALPGEISKVRCPLHSVGKTNPHPILLKRFRFHRTGRT